MKHGESAVCGSVFRLLLSKRLPDEGELSERNTLLKARAEVKFRLCEAQRRGGLRIAKETKPIVEATTSLEARLSIGAVGIVASNYSTGIQRQG